MKKNAKYWYLFTYEDCVLCGKGNTTKQRIYDKPKPKDPYKRHIHKDYACGCHFV